MFIAVIFVCLNIGECAFVVSPVVKSPAMCQAILKEQYRELAKKQEEIAIAAGNCIELSENKGEI